MRLLYLTIIISLLIAGSVMADQTGQPSLKFQAGLIHCFDKNGTDTLRMDNCLSFGLISIGDSRKQVVKLLGNPDRLVTGLDTAQIGIYPLTPKKTGDDPYLLVTINNQIVTTLTLQGRGTTQRFSFSGISLGDSSSVIVGLLGPPARVVSHEGYGSELWSYGAYPFSFEIEDNLVLSIQIWMVSEEK